MKQGEPIDDVFALPLGSNLDLDGIEAYDYALPDKLIATTPTSRREESRLLVSRRGDKKVQGKLFRDLIELLDPGDLLVFNNTRVIPARIELQKETGGRVELFVLAAMDEKGSRIPWEAPLGGNALLLDCMTRASKPLRPGMELASHSKKDGLSFLVQEVQPGRARIGVLCEKSPLALLDEYGEIPLPPYIVRQRQELGKASLSEEDEDRYQTVFASVAGAVAAPTAGLHFSKELLRGLLNKGVQKRELTLTVGPGTFQPVRSTTLSGHEMHCEEYFIPEGLGQDIEETRRKGGRVIAVGTTSARALEAETRRKDAFSPGWKETDIFLRPGADFLLLDGLITNFHLPRSTLLAMIAAFLGYEEMRHLYNFAISEGLRFYSYGDASLLWGTAKGLR